MTKPEKTPKKIWYIMTLVKVFYLKTKITKYICIQRRKKFEKIIDFNKIKEFLKINKKRDSNTNRTDRDKNDLIKSHSFLFRNQTEKIINY